MQNVDTTPLALIVPGILNLDVMLYPQADGRVEVKGQLGFAVSKTVDSAMSFLPAIIRWGLSSSLIQRELNGRRFRFSVGKITSVDTELSDNGNVSLSARYQNPLARPVGHSETTKIFRTFAKGLANAGLTPNGNDVIEAFIKDFTRNYRATLPFLELFEGKSIVTASRTTGPLVGLNLSQLEMVQDKAGDLLVHFEGLGRIEGVEADVEERLAG